MDTAKTQRFQNRISKQDYFYISLFGICDSEGELYELTDMCGKAFAVLKDGTSVPLGSKRGGGTAPNGEFEIGWLLDTLIDPESIEEIHIGDNVITLE